MTKAVDSAMANRFHDDRQRNISSLYVLYDNAVVLDWSFVCVEGLKIDVATCVHFTSKFLHKRKPIMGCFPAKISSTLNTELILPEEQPMTAYSF